MSNSIIAQQTLFEPCPDPWAQRHIFYNPKTKQVIPARCRKWTCFACAKINYYVVDFKLAGGNPQRFITLSRAGRTPEEINHNLKKLMQAIRREGWIFEYGATVELHLNGNAHLHILQRGSYIPQKWLSEKWKSFTAKSYGGKGSFIVDIREIQDNQNVRGYLLKYLKKSWEQEKQNPKSWAALQAAYPGLNHYRMSKNWLSKPSEKVEKWQLILKDMLPDGPVESWANVDRFMAEPLPPLDPGEKKRLNITGHRKLLPVEVSRAKSNVLIRYEVPLIPANEDRQLTFGLVDTIQPTPQKKRGSYEKF